MRMTKNLIVLVPLILMLYIAPIAQNPYYASLAIQPDLDYASAEYLDESTSSINGFSETLPSNTFYTPDGFYDDTPVYAFEGNDDWYESIGVDSLNWSIFSSSEICSYMGLYPIEGFDYSVYAYGAGGGGNLSVASITFGDPIEGHLIEVTSTTPQWYNGTYFGRANTHGNRIDLYSQNNVGAIVINHIELRFYYLPLLDYSYYSVHGYDNWGTSFTNVSGWYFKSAGNLVAGQYGIGTDGDVGEIWCDFQDSDNEYVIYEYDLGESNSIERYCEFIFTCETANVMIYVTVIDSNSVSYNIVAGGVSTSTRQWKYYMGNYPIDDIEKIQLRVDDTTSAVTGNLSITLDYIRIAHADEMGFGYDGSTLQNVDNDALSGITYTESTDGNILTQSVVSSVASGKYPHNEILFDTTSTVADIERDYYPFWVLKYRVLLDNQSSTIYGRIYSDGYRSSTALITDGEWHTFRFNHKVQTTSSGGIVYFSYVGYTDGVGEGYIVQTDYLQAYSIANFTLLQASTEVTDYLFVSGGSIISNLDGTSGEYIAMYNDYDLNVDTSIFNYFNISVLNYDSDGLDFAFRPYLHANLREYNYDATSGDFLTTDELDNFWFYFYDELELASIVFTDMHRWHEVEEMIIIDCPEWHPIDTITIIVWLEMNTFIIEMILLFGGLILIPLSIIYLFYNIRNREMSSDKGLYFCIALMIGIALFIGGIMAG